MAVSLYISVGESSTIRIRAMKFPIRNRHHRLVAGHQEACSTGTNSGTCALMAPSSSSLLKGLVRYWSEPTIRPLALSNRPSLEDSMITGVDLKALLFLIRAQV